MRLTGLKFLESRNFWLEDRIVSCIYTVTELPITKRHSSPWMLQLHTQTGPWRDSDIAAPEEQPNIYLYPGYGSSDLGLEVLRMSCSEESGPDT